MRKEGELLQAGSRFGLGSFRQRCHGNGGFSTKKKADGKTSAHYCNLQFGGDFSRLEVGVFGRAGAGSLGTAQQVQIKT
jgi:hypothetical protein